MERTAILNKEKNFVSCVLYLHNDDAHIRDFLNTVCGTMEEHFEKYPLAMAYVPWQHFTKMYENLEKGYQAGTIFPELDKPFTGRRCVK